MTGPLTPDPAAFWRFELGGWDYAAGAYADHWLSLTRQAIPDLLDAANVGPGTRVLDVASGPGIVAQAVAERGARVLGVDFSLNMVGLARAAYPDLEFISGDAERLPVRPESLDAVVMNFGMLHLGRPERAVAEAFGALQSGGRFAFTVWAPPDQALLFGAILESIQEHGDTQITLPVGPPFFRFSDPEIARQLVANAGFTESRVEPLPLVWRAASPGLLFDAMLHGTARTGGLLRRQAADDLELIRAAVIERLEPFADGDGVSLPMTASLTSARKP
jgi:SAM-dependent methyltransferase